MEWYAVRIAEIKTENPDDIELYYSLIKSLINIDANMNVSWVFFNPVAEKWL